jgi:putative MATE family efflux protein
MGLLGAQALSSNCVARLRGKSPASGGAKEQDMNRNAEALANEKVGALILKFSIPSIAGMLVNGLYNVMDRIFVGRGVGPQALAGVAIVFPLMLLVMAVGMLVGMGASSLIALKLGAGRREEAEAAVGTAFSMALGLSTLFTLSVGLFMRPILEFFGGSGEILAYAMRFTSFYLPGMFLQILAFSLNNMIRGQGEPVTALLTMVLSAAVNCVLNPLFIFGFHMGIAGSALATDIAQLVSCAWLLSVYLTTKKGLRLRPAIMRPRARVARDILSIGMVPAFVQVANVATLILANNLMARYGGDEGVAVMGIATSLMNLMLMPIIGVNQGIQPIIGFNYGAGLFGRAQRALRLALVGVCGICAAAYALFFAFSGPLVGLFVPGQAGLRALGVHGMRIFLCSIPVVGVVMLGTGYFQAVKKPLQALVPNMIRQLVLLVPLYLALPRFLGLDGIFMAGPLTDAVSVLATLAFLAPEMRSLGAKASRRPVALAAAAE